MGAAISTINFDYQVPDLALTIKNGTVKGFNWGLHLGSNYVYGSNVYVTDLTFRGNTVAIAQVHIDLWIDESLFQENQRGLNGGESAWHVSDSVFRSNTYAVDIADAEIWFDNNRFVDNATGLRTERTGIRLYDNTFTGGGVGVLSIMSKNYGMVLSRNSFIGLGLGVDTSISATVTIDNNVFKGNGASGLNLRDVWAGTVTGNTFVGNGFSPGIYADPSGNPLTAGLWTSIDGNGTIAHNTAIGNAGYGIEAHGAVDGGGNIARGNGNPAQCLGVVCTKK